jgi:very-short-patch-repair endonuclease
LSKLYGSQHAQPGKKWRDAARSANLGEQGYRVIRFWNEQVKREMNEVVEAIMQR